MKTLLITTAFLTAPLVSSVTAQTSDALKRQIAEQNRQIASLENTVSSLQAQLNLERKRHGKAAIPTKMANTTTSKGTYTVQPGDTFYSIAQKNGISLSSLIAANKGISPNKIAVNQKLVIPQVNTVAKVKAKPVTKTKTSSAPSTKKTTATGKYTVQKGDTFYGIAKKHNITIRKLIAMNPEIKPTKLRIGQVLNLTSTRKTATVAKKTTSAKTSKPKPVAKPTPTIKAKPTPTPQPIKHSEPTNIAKTVTVTNVMTYGEFASKNGTTISVLNAMNGLDLPADEPMAVGSALYVPSK